MRKNTSFIVSGVALILFFAFSQRLEAKKIKSTGETENAFYTVWRVADGDTLKLSNDERVVLAGVDAPEAFLNRKVYDQSRTTGEKMKNILLKGRYATRYMRSLVEGQRVRLEPDKRFRDKHDQIIAFVFLEDGTFVNAEILKQGYAKAVPVPSEPKYQDMLKQFEQEAKDNKRGLWAYGNI